MSDTLNAVARHRRERGLSQAELAQAAGLSRQALSAVEAGRSVPSTAIALRLARVLGRSVEELFWLEDEREIEVWLPEDNAHLGRARIGRVDGRWVAHPIDPASIAELADAEIVEVRGSAGRARFLTDPSVSRDRLLVAGCDPALGLLAGAAERVGVALAWIPETSTRALEALAKNEVHFAGAHLFDPASGEHNVPFVRRRVKRPCIIVELASTEEGLLVASQNPRDILSVSDLARSGVRFVNRPLGAAARDLLDREIARARISPDAIVGYDRTAAGHEAVARAVAEGAADAGVATRAVALAHGLSFVSLHAARFDLVIPRELLARPAMERLLALLAGGFRRQLAALGYDADGTGRVAGQT